MRLGYSSFNNITILTNTYISICNKGVIAVIYTKDTYNNVFNGFIYGSIKSIKRK